MSTTTHTTDDTHDTREDDTMSTHHTRECDRHRPEPLRASHYVGTCRHCDRRILWDEGGGVWVDPEATGDDAVWREVCDQHDTFTAEHEPAGPDRSTDPAHRPTDHAA